jgi:signal transduction histidine kinase
VVFSAAASAVGVGLIALTLGWGAMVDSYTPYSLIVTIGVGLIVWLAAGEQARNRLIWVLAASMAGTGFFGLSEGIRLLLDPDGPLTAGVDTTVPAEMPTAAAWTNAVGAAIATSASALLVTFAVLLFPDGRLPSRRWRPVAAVLAFALAVQAAFSLVHWNPGSEITPNDQAWFPLSSNLTAVCAPIAFAGLMSRFRRSEPAERVRIKWILWGLGVFVVVNIVGANLAMPLVIMAGFVVLFTAFGIGIVRHNLFDVNVVISRSVAYAMLAALIGSIYVSVVVGVGSLLGSGDEPNAVLAIAATALVAVAFQPARLRLQRLANRLVFGRRATPYEVLSEFSRRVAATGDSLLADASRSLVEGTAAERVVVTLDLGADTIEAAAWPNDVGSIETEVVRFPILEAGSPLGSLDLYLPSEQTLPDGERLLAEHLASGMGLALGNRALSERLSVRLDELRESRRRLVAVQDDTRRRLERDLHDGAQQQLVALKVKLGLCRSLVERSGDAEMVERVERLSADADDAVESLRDFARGVFPPLLESEGLAAAIGAQVRRSGLTVDVETNGLGRYPREIESTVYFCVLEALADVAERARANHARVQLTQRNGSLTFEVHDNDVVVATRPGLRRIGDRLEALSGTLDYRSEPGSGTTVTGSLPAPATAVMS